MHSPFAQLPDPLEQLSRRSSLDGALLQAACVPGATAAGGALGGLAHASSTPGSWMQPSGPRHAGQGVEEVEQGVMLAEPTHTGGALLRITLLAAGFCIGPSGSSVRDICKATGTDIKSWTAEADAQCSRACRMFRVEGPRQGVAKAVSILCDAVARYKELCEGQYVGQSVMRVQHVSGVDFSYQPPPRSIVPYAAALKGQATARRQGSKPTGRQAGPGSRKPPTAPRPKEASLARTASLETSSAAGLLPRAALARSASLPQAHASSCGNSSSTDSTAGLPAASDIQAAVAVLQKKMEQPQPAAFAGVAADSSSAFSSSSGPASGPASDRGVPAQRRIMRSASQAPPTGASPAHMPSSTDKLEKGDVLKSIFGIAEAAMQAPEQQGPITGQDISVLLQQLASWSAEQQGSHGGHILTEPGVVLPAPLSPVPAACQQLPGFGSSPGDTQLATQGVADNAGMLSAVAAAWQDSQQLLQLASMGLAGFSGGGSLQPGSRGPSLSPYPSLDDAVAGNSGFAGSTAFAAGGSCGSLQSSFAGVISSPEASHSLHLFAQQAPSTPEQPAPSAAALHTPSAVPADSGWGALPPLFRHSPLMAPAMARAASAPSPQGPNGLPSDQLQSLLNSAGSSTARQPERPGAEGTSLFASAFSPRWLPSNMDI